MLYAYSIVQVCAKVNTPQDYCSRSSKPQPLLAHKEAAPAHKGRGFLRRAFLHSSTMTNASEAQRAKRPS